MFCKNCGAVIESGTRFCASCGLSVVIEPKQAKPVHMSRTKTVVLFVLLCAISAIIVYFKYLSYGV